MKIRFENILFCLLMVLLGSCQTTKYLGEEEQLYNGAKLELKGSPADQPDKNLQAEIKSKIRQQPNKKIFGQRFKLWVNQQFRNHQKEKGFKHWLKTKIGEPPVLYQEQLTEQSQLLIERHLKNEGYLHAKVLTDTLVKGKEVNVIYKIKSNGRYKISNYILPPDSTKLLALINEKIKKPFIQPGKYYSLAAINAERIRIENLARQNGFYEFNQSGLYFYLDTAIQQTQAMDVYLYVRPPADQKNYRPHRLGDVTIYPDYILNQSEGTRIRKDTIEKDGWTLIQNKEIVKLSTFQEAIAQDSGAVFNQRLENQAINYLLDLGVFKFVNLKYQKEIIDSQAILHRNFYLTPSLNQDFSVSLEATSERSNFLGSNVGVNYTHRNIFNGAEQFKVGLTLGLETQAGGNTDFVNTIETAFNTGLTIPRLWLPFNITRRIKSAIPKTLINFKASYQKRNTLFTSASLLAELGYSWKKNQFVQHQFYPFQFTTIRLLNTSTAFEEELVNNPQLKASFEDVVILASNYRFLYSTQLYNARKDFIYFRGEVETAGNVASLITQDKDGDGSKSIWNTPLAQYARAQAELRHTWYQRKTSLVGRLSTGLAIPYGNSEAVPYIRQFFVGGASSIRAFRFRGVGPGNYSPDEDGSSSDLNFIDRVGDIKLEGNIEYRFPLAGYLNGAIFIDAGNVWLTEKSSFESDTGVFKPDQFYKELAVGTGFGLRLDIQYVVIRLDLAFPLRDPSLPDGSRWTMSDIDFSSKSWRSDNLKFNLAIGYPF